MTEVNGGRGVTGYVPTDIKIRPTPLILYGILYVTDGHCSISEAITEAYCAAAVVVDNPSLV